MNPDVFLTRVDLFLIDFDLFMISLNLFKISLCEPYWEWEFILTDDVGVLETNPSRLIPVK